MARRPAPVYDVPPPAPLPTDAASEGAMDVKTAAAFMAICVRSLRDLIAAKQIPHHRRGRKVVLFRRDLVAFLANERLKAGAV